MHYVYILESSRHRLKRYTGSTSDLKSRLTDHNAGRNASTSDARPWRLVAYFGFPNPGVAFEFERYLKSGSGKTFARRHFL
jgi:putative endonuclease